MMIEIDGSQGEGGGQILRTSLALSVITSQPCRIDNIRAGRAKPGLQRQHLTAVRAAAQIGQAHIEGDEIGSRQLTFSPSGLVAGDHRFDIGSAGSCTLVLQTVLPPLMLAAAGSQVCVQGGTHNPHAPPFEFLTQTFLPLAARMGFSVAVQLDRPGFYPVGCGQIAADIQGSPRPVRFELLERGAIRRQKARAIVARLPREIAERELKVIADELGWDPRQLDVEEWTTARSPGNVVLVEIESEHVTETFVGFGQRGVRAEAVADGVVREVQAYLKTNVPVGPHLADQLILPLALGAGGTFVTSEPTLHTLTNLEVVKMFLDIEATISPLAHAAWQITIDPPTGR